MISQKQKILLTATVVLFLVAGGYFLVLNFQERKIKTTEPSQEVQLVDKDWLNEGQQCQQNFVFSDDKIKWAEENKRIGFFDRYFFCKAGLVEDYKICDSAIFEEESKQGDQKICRKIVQLKQVFLPLSKDKEVAAKTISNLQYYLDNYDKKLKERIISFGGVEKFLNAYLNKDVSVCGDDGDCKSFVSRDGRYCSTFDETLNGASCIEGAKLMRAIDSQDIKMCGEIKDDILRLTCELIFNKNENLCASKEFLADFVGQYCFFNTPGI